MRCVSSWSIATAQAIRVLLPYKRRRLRRGVDYGELGAAPGQPRIWSSS
jgi:hypothetical protein